MIRKEYKKCYKVFLLVWVGFPIVSQAAAWTTATNRKRSHSFATTTVPLLQQHLSLASSPFQLHLTADDENGDDDWGTDDDDISQQTFLAPSTDERQDDMFIPIFALVSLAGLFGTYAYEMIRLWSRGELYLPWS